MTVSSIYKLLDKMEMMVLKGTPIPFSPMIIINHEKLIDLLDKIRASIPGEIQEAHAIMKKRDDIFINAQNQADQIINEAKARAAEMVRESEILKAVQAEAEKIRASVITDCEAMKREAKEESERVRTTAINEAISIREGADKYAETVLSNLDRDLTDLHTIVKNGQRQLAKIKADSISNMTAQKARINTPKPQVESEVQESMVN